MKSNRETRNDRVALFEYFQVEGRKAFENLSKRSYTYRKFKESYSLNICPKGRDGGINNRVFEVFYGENPFDQEIKIQSDFSEKRFLLYEQGATLSFQLNDYGYVAVILFPPSTDRMKPIESAIFIKNNIHPNKLFNSCFLRMCWNDLNRCMEIFSMLGKPTLFTRLHWLLWISNKNTVVNNIYQEKKNWKTIKKIIQYVISVGLSGFLIYIFTIWPSQSDTTDKHIIGISLKLDTIIKEQKRSKTLHIKNNRAYNTTLGEKK